MQAHIKLLPPQIWKWCACALILAMPGSVLILAVIGLAKLISGKFRVAAAHK